MVFVVAVIKQAVFLSALLSLVLVELSSSSSSSSSVVADNNNNSNLRGSRQGERRIKTISLVNPQTKSVNSNSNNSDDGRQGSSGREGLRIWNPIKPKRNGLLSTGRPTLMDWKTKCTQPACSENTAADISHNICLWCLKALATTSASVTPDSLGVESCVDTMCGETTCTAEELRPYFACGLRLEYPEQHSIAYDEPISEPIIIAGTTVVGNDGDGLDADINKAVAGVGAGAGDETTPSISVVNKREVDGIDAEISNQAIVEGGRDGAGDETTTTTTTETTTTVNDDFADDTTADTALDAVTTITDPTTPPPKIDVVLFSPPVWDDKNCPAVFPGSGTDCVMVVGTTYKKCMYYERGPSAMCTCSADQPIWSCTGITILAEDVVIVEDTAAPTNALTTNAPTNAPTDALTNDEVEDEDEEEELDFVDDEPVSEIDDGNNNSTTSIIETAQEEQEEEDDEEGLSFVDDDPPVSEIDDDENNNSTTASSSCSAAPRCQNIGLTGDCCPTNDGTYLDCCAAANDDEYTAESALLPPPGVRGRRGLVWKETKPTRVQFATRPTVNDWKTKCSPPTCLFPVDTTAAEENVAETCMWCLKALATTSATPESPGLKNCADTVCRESTTCTVEELRPYFACGLRLEYPERYVSSYDEPVTLIISEGKVVDGIDVEVNQALAATTDPTPPPPPNNDNNVNTTTPPPPNTDVVLLSPPVWDTWNCPALFPGSGTECVMVNNTTFKKCMYYERGPSAMCTCSAEQPIWLCTGTTSIVEEEVQVQEPVPSSPVVIVAVEEKEVVVIEETPVTTPPAVLPVEEAVETQQDDDYDEELSFFNDEPVFEIDDDNNSTTTIISETLPPQEEEEGDDDEEELSFVDHSEPVFDIDDNNSTITTTIIETPTVILAPPAPEEEEEDLVVVEEETLVVTPPALPVEEEKVVVVGEETPVTPPAVVVVVPPVVSSVVEEEEEVVEEEFFLVEPTPVEEEFFLVEPTPVEEEEFFLVEPTPVEEEEFFLVEPTPVEEEEFFLVEPTPVEEEEVGTTEELDTITVASITTTTTATTATTTTNSGYETCPVNMPTSSGMAATKCNMPSDEKCCYSVQTASAVVCKCNSDGIFSCDISDPAECLDEDTVTNTDIDTDTAAEEYDFTAISGRQDNNNNAAEDLCPLERPGQGVECSTGVYDRIDCCYGTVSCECSYDARFSQKYVFTCMSGSSWPNNCN